MSSRTTDLSRDRTHDEGADAGKTQEAIRQYELALPSDMDGSLHFRLARLFRRTGDPHQAQLAEAEAQVLIKRRLAGAAIAVRETSRSR